MNDTYLQQALEKIPDKNLLVNVAAKRAAEISRGSRPLVQLPQGTKVLDVVLLEIAEGKVRIGK